MTKLREELTARGVASRLFDRHSELVGPPVLGHCDPPLDAWRSGDGTGDHGYATIYVCRSETEASDASVPALPGHRVRSGPIFAVVNADAPLARDVQAAIRATR